MKAPVDHHQECYQFWTEYQKIQKSFSIADSTSTYYLYKKQYIT